MRRMITEKRPHLTRLLQSQGLTYWEGTASEGYWPDDRYYSFTNDEIKLLEKAGKDVFDMCCEAAEYLMEHTELVTEKMAIPAFALQQIKQSWDREPAWGSVYARFDICFGGVNHPDPRLRTPKFYEFNADTPTSVVEAASLQWLWLEQTGHGNDQFNYIIGNLIEAWQRNLALIEQNLGKSGIVVHFAIARDEEMEEEAMNTALLIDTCQKAGWRTKVLFMDEIAKSRTDGRFYDQAGEHIDVIFKLYPWEFIIEEPFGEAVFKDMENIGQHNEAGEYIGGTVWIEPPYKMLWSNKAIFAILWDLFKDDPRSIWLLPTFFENERPASLTNYARKPIFSRQGDDLSLQADDKVLQHVDTGYYGKEGYIVQELALPPVFKDLEGKSHFPVLGLWIIDGDVAGLGIREGTTPITMNETPFIPHSISDVPMNYQKCPVPDSDEIEAALSLQTYMTTASKWNAALDYIARIFA
ncbi:glutathionylspermidine synthase [Ampelomyces quisqualis]|uniref:Glutathionylspermidine synthase n=1 Tax=Ampelomyces quisqualis TaxID=50730 RepID=A0A6A5QEP5_AMPQU|nr:glutathionylspermidine synthase [Ampelomyces quisqualis]